MSLKDGIKKMLKFDLVENFWINLIDDVDIIVCKIKKLKIDILGDMFDFVDGFEGCLEVVNFVGIYVVLVGQIDEQVLLEFGGKGFGIFKLVLVDFVVLYLFLIIEDMWCLLDDLVEIDVVLVKGIEKVNVVVVFIIEEVWCVVGFW